MAHTETYLRVLGQNVFPASLEIDERLSSPVLFDRIDEI